MISGEQIDGVYSWLTVQPNLEAAVRGLENGDLREVNGALSRLGAENGIPGLIHGLVIVEAARRFFKEKEEME
jgi:hypothetical protein